MEDLSDNERNIIKDNWDDILKNSKQNEPYILKKNTINILCISRNDDIQIIIKVINENNNSKESKRSKRFEISKKARIMKFKIKEESREEQKEELIYNPESIDYFTKYYKMQHPIYKNKINKDSEETLDISVGPSNYRTIFDDSTITEIYDDRFCGYIKEEEYINYFDKLEINVSDYYDDSSLNYYSKKINNDGILYSKERKELIEFIKDIKYLKENFIFIIGCQKIGLSFTILQQVKNMKILYLCFDDLFDIKKNSDKKKYIFRKLFNWFNDYKAYESFINKEIFNITGYDNLLQIIKLIIISLCSISKENDSVKYIILDNYNDFYVGTLKLSVSYIEDLYCKLDKKILKL